MSILLVILFSGFYTKASWQQYGQGDWDLTYFYAELARQSLIDHHQLPAWNPYSCGGTDFYSNIQTFHFGIFFPLVLLFGAVRGMKLQIILFYLAGFWGMFFYLKKLRINILDALAGSGLFAFSTYFAWHGIYEGHHNSMVIFTLPWWLWSYEYYRSSGYKFRWWHFLLPVFIITNLVLDGASYPLLYVPLFFGSYVLAEGIAGKKTWKSLRFALVTVILGMGAGLFKLYPAVVYMFRYPRAFLDKTSTGIIDLLHLLADSQPCNLKESFSYWGWHEYGASFSLAAGVFVVVFARKLKWKWPVWVVLLFWFWVAMGNVRRGYNPWIWLNDYVPGFQSIRVPSRAIVFLYMLLVPAFMTVLQRLNLNRKVVLALLGGLLLQLYIQNRSIFLSWKKTPNSWVFQHEVAANNGFRWVLLDSAENNVVRNMYPHARNNLGTLNAKEPMDIEKAEFVATNDSLPLVRESHVKVIHWTPNQITFKADTLRKFLVYQNFHPGWQVESGKASLNEKEGALQVVPGTKKVIIRFRPPHATEGFWLSLPFVLLIFGSAAFFWYRRGDR